MTDRVLRGRAKATDISGRPIPPDRTPTREGINRVIAIPPVREKPNEQAQEFLWFGFNVFPANNPTFLILPYPFSGAGQWPSQLDKQTVGRIDALCVQVPDMVAAATAYIYFRLTNLGQSVPGYDAVPVYPRNGMASLSIDANIDLPAGSNLTGFAQNTDPVNTHFIGIYVHGWTWPADLQQG